MSALWLLLLGCSQPQPQPPITDTSAPSTTGTTPTATSTDPDLDGDGYEGDEDCDPNDGDIHPFAGDEGGDGIDSDCDGLDCTAFWSDDLTAYFVLCPDAMTWSEAATFCTDSGYVFASIRSVDEQRLLTEVLTALVDTEQAWFGYHDQTKEGAWRWVDEGGSSYTAWGIGQPDNANNGDCAQIGFDGGYQWNDVACDSVADTRGLLCSHRDLE